MAEDKITQVDIEATEDFVMSVLTNEPSDYTLVDKFKTLVVFQRPSLTNKFKQRAWANRKLKELEIDDDDQQLAFFFRYWGTLNSYVIKVLTEDTKGVVKFGGKKYTEYAYDPSQDADYKSLFEKFVMEQIYNKGLSEEAFVSEVIVLHADWINSNTVAKEADIKNS